MHWHTPLMPDKLLMPGDTLLPRPITSERANAILTHRSAKTMVKRSLAMNLAGSTQPWLARLGSRRPGTIQTHLQSSKKCSPTGVVESHSTTGT